ncbi:MAG: hypothetical protein HFI94_08835 [Lachnospiraceae bacterium]|jgi:hypothetical protein|nr:hypothetical protein [Lachnospiraceae bacterium]
MKPSVSSEKKLQLIRRIRQEHQMNQNTIRGREAFLYGKNNLYESFSDAESGEMPESELPISTFRLRMAAALLLFGLFYMVSSRDKSFFGIDTQQVYEAVEKDYSSILFDFMDEIPYTLHE